MLAGWAARRRLRGRSSSSSWSLVGGAKSHCASSWAGWLPLLPYATVQLLACRGQRIAFCFLNARLPPQSPTTS